MHQVFTHYKRYFVAKIIKTTPTTCIGGPRNMRLLPTPLTCNIHIQKAQAILHVVLLEERAQRNVRTINFGQESE